MKRKVTTALNTIPKRCEVFIGIDPDVDKSGVAYVDKTTRKLETAALAESDLRSYLLFVRNSAEQLKTSYVVVIEASWLIGHNWNVHYKMNVHTAAATGHSAGRNHQVGISIAKFCEENNIRHYLALPLKKCWRGANGKISHAELQSFTGIMSKTNQEQRDAALLAWVHAQLPIKLQFKK